MRCCCCWRCWEEDAPELVVAEFAEAVAVEGSSASRMPLEESISEPIRSGGGWGEEADVARAAAEEQLVRPPPPELPALLNICNVTAGEEKAHSVRHTTGYGSG